MLAMNPLRTISRLAVGLIAIPLFAQAALASPVTNGDFEAGATGFTSDYSLDNSDCQPPQIYATVGDPTDCHPSIISFPAHGGSLMMVVNGATAANQTVWSSSPVGIVSGTTYDFSAWATAVYPASPANLEFFIDGSSVGFLQLTSGTPDWSQFSYLYHANTPGSVTLSIIDRDVDFNGNDFAIDDITFDEVRPAPEPMTLALMGAGLAGLGLRRRRRV
jgi:hypothetical protein